MIENKKSEKVLKIANGEYVLEAIHGSSDHPLKIANIEIPCYVLEDGKRVLVQSGILNALDLSQGTADKRVGGDRLSKFIETKGIRESVNEELNQSIINPIRFKAPNGVEAYGYEATILADICDAVLAARKSGKLHRQQYRIAEQCEILLRGFARVGIVALVDEATGYQDVRTRQALEKILEKFISAELAKWAKRFPDEFYKEMFRLRSWKYNPDSVKRPGVIGTYTNDLVYSRLAPGILEELKHKSDDLLDENKKSKPHFHRWLTEDIGHPALQSHLAAVIALMKASPDWKTFYRLLNRALPKFGETLQLDIFDQNGIPL